MTVNLIEEKLAKALSNLTKEGSFPTFGFEGTAGREAARAIREMIEAIVKEDKNDQV